jgi:hypothetical protein
MKELTVLTHVKMVVTAFDRVFFSFNPDANTPGIYEFKGGQLEQFSPETSWLFLGFDKYMFLQNSEGGPIKVITRDGNILKKFEGVWYLDVTAYESFVLARHKVNNGKKIVLIGKDLTQIDLKTRYKFISDSGLISIEENSVLKKLNFLEIEDWQINLVELISHYPSIISKENPNRKLVSREILCDALSFYVPIEGGSILSINQENGKINWVHESNLIGGYVLRDKILYKNTGDELIEISVDSGQILRRTEYKSFDQLKAIFGFTGEYKVYHDIILLKDQLRGLVAAFSRDSLSLLATANIGSKLASHGEIMHCNNNELFILDIENRLTIFSLNEKKLEIDAV